jgi:two-component system response regulator PilR (NtrC family)
VRVKRFDPEAVGVLMNCTWPGNVRELENAVERLVIMTPDETVRPEHMQDALRNYQPCADALSIEIPAQGLDMEALLENAERTLLRKALERTGGVKTEAAKLLGLSFRSFRHRLRKYEPV